MNIHLLTLFPEMFTPQLTAGVVGRAVQRGLVQVHAHNPRDVTDSKHGRVDERPFGGGPGMVMQCQPLVSLLEQRACPQPLIYVSPQGAPFNQAWAQKLSQLEGFTVLCGRYEGVDERFIREHVDFELSLGDFVLSGGEIAAMALVDAVVRLIPEVLGDADSAQQDSFSAHLQGLLDCPHYTRPEVWRNQSVPDVLLSGNHAAIARWRLQQSLGQTFLKRPDLLHNMRLTSAQLRLLQEFISEM